MRSIVVLVLLVFPSWLFAAVQVGTGLSSATSGRMVPGLELGVGTESYRGSFNTVGVSSAYYYHSSYTMSFFRTWKAGQLLWGEVESGLGGGLMYAVRGFRDDGTSKEEKKNDVALGPAFFVQWHFLGPAYLKLDMVWGLRSLTGLVGLNGQDVIFLSFGLRAW